MSKTFYTAAGIGLLVIGLSAHALAADMRPAFKAPSAFPFDSQGVFYGLSTQTATSKTEITTPSGVSTGEIAAVGAGIGPSIGYWSGNAANFKAVQCSVYYQNLGGSQIATGADVNTDKISGGCTLMLGGTATLTNLAALLPANLGLQGVFPGTGPVGGVSSIPYGGIGIDISKPRFQVLGVTADNNYVPRIAFEMGFFTRVLDAAGKDTGFATKTWAKYLPPAKGTSIGGGTLLGDGNATDGRVFMIGLDVLK